MTEPTSTSAATAAPLSLVSRAIGVITSPKATFENVVAFPKPAGILFVVALVISVGSSIPQFTEAGRHAVLEQQVKTMERFGATVTPEIYAAMEARSQSPVTRVIGIAIAFVILPIVSLFFAALYWAAFNTVMGGTATFKQVLAIVTHSQVVSALGLLAGLPIQLMRGTISMTGPFNLGALAPMLDQGSKLAMFLGSISLFTVGGHHRHRRWPGCLVQAQRPRHRWRLDCHLSVLRPGFHVRARLVYGPGRLAQAI